MAAWNGGRLGESRRTWRVCEERAGGLRCGYGSLFEEDFPAVRHHQGQLRRDDE
jgi:hypothetical protein